MHFSIDIMRFVIQSFLIIYTFLKKPQDLQTNEDAEFLVMSQPLFYENLKKGYCLKKPMNQLTNAEDLSLHENFIESTKKMNNLPIKLLIESKNKVVFHLNESYYEIKVSLSTDNLSKNYKILRNLRDFLQLEKDLLKEIETKSYLFSLELQNIAQINHNVSNDFNYSISNPFLVEKLSLYLNKLTQHLELFTINLILFLEIPQPFKKILVQAHNNLIKKLIEERNEKNYKENLLKSLKNSNNESFFDVFEVQVIEKDPEKCEIELSLIEIPKEKWFVSKKIEEIINFLENKSFLVDEGSFLFLQQGIQRICNENKEILLDKEFLLFFEVSEKIQDILKVYFQREICSINSLKVEIVGNLKIYNEKKAKNDIFFNILVESEETNEKKVVFFKNIYKKYKHFKELHFFLLKKFKGKDNELPELPLKTEYNLKDSLETYLKKLIKYKYIGQSLAFRRFLNVCFLKGSFIEEPFFEKMRNLDF